MKLSKKYRLERIAKGVDIFTHLKLKDGRVWAINRTGIVSVPAWISKREEGLLSIKVLKHVRKLLKKKETQFQLSLKGPYAAGNDGVLIPRKDLQVWDIREAAAPRGKGPAQDKFKVGKKTLPPSAEILTKAKELPTLYRACVNAQLLANIAHALGDEQVMLEFKDEGVIITPLNDREETKAEALLLPVMHEE